MSLTLPLPAVRPWVRCIDFLWHSSRFIYSAVYSIILATCQNQHAPNQVPYIPPAHPSLVLPVFHPSMEANCFGFILDLSIFLIAHIQNTRKIILDILSRLEHAHKPSTQEFKLRCLRPGLAYRVKSYRKKKEREIERNKER